MEHGTYNIKVIFSSLTAFVSLILLDQISKYIIRHSGGFYVCNPNVAFGIEIPAIWFWIFWIGIMGVISRLLYQELRKQLAPQEPSDDQNLKNRAKLMYIGALVFILAGALSNMIDRATWGCVVDFIDWRVWPVFNLADSFILAGAFFWLAKIGKM